MSENSRSFVDPATRGVRRTRECPNQFFGDSRRGDAGWPRQPFLCTAHQDKSSAAETTMVAAAGTGYALANLFGIRS